MRPVVRGAIPADARSWTHYTDAYWPLEERLGPFCSYCEMRLNASLAVEHMMAKVSNPSRVLEWDNFLLACPHCNSVKGTADIEPARHLAPDVDDTFSAYEYRAPCLVSVAAQAAEADRAHGTSDLVGLERLPGAGATDSDKRWHRRWEAWDIAEQALAEWHGDGGGVPSLNRIAVLAERTGNFSVWMRVFGHVPEVRATLIRAFAGTDASRI